MVCIKRQKVFLSCCVLGVTRIGFRKPIPWMIELGETEFKLSKNFPFPVQNFFFSSASSFLKKKLQEFAIKVVDENRGQ